MFFFLTFILFLKFTNCISFELAQLCPTLCNPTDCSHQAPLSMEFSRQEYWSGVAISFPRGSSQPRDQTWVSCITGRFFIIWATREARAAVSPCGRLEKNTKTIVALTLWWSNSPPPWVLERYIYYCFSFLQQKYFSVLVRYKIVIYLKYTTW